MFWDLSNVQSMLFKPHILELQHNTVTNKPWSKGSTANINPCITMYSPSDL